MKKLPSKEIFYNLEANGMKLVRILHLGNEGGGSAAGHSGIS